MLSMGTRHTTCAAYEKQNQFSIDQPRNLKHQKLVAEFSNDALRGLQNALSGKHRKHTLTVHENQNQVFIDQLRDQKHQRPAAETGLL